MPSPAKELAVTKKDASGDLGATKQAADPELLASRNGNGQGEPVTPTADAVAESSSPAVGLASPIPDPPGDFDSGHAANVSQGGTARVDLDRGQRSGATHGSGASVSSNGNGHVEDGTRKPFAVADNLNGDQELVDTQPEGVADASEDSQVGTDPHTPHADPSEALLLILADALDDLERQRIASENRLRSLRQVKQLEGSKAEAHLAELTGALKEMEHAMAIQLRRAMRAHPLGAFVKRTIGLGEKQAARLIAAIGDPAWNQAEGRPRRGPAELWAYCGYDPAQKRRKGVQSNWNAQAKMRAYLCAESCMKQRSSPYREVYERERAKWADRDTSDLHKHNHALRVVAKEILKDLWREARATDTTRPMSVAPVPVEAVA